MTAQNRRRPADPFISPGATKETIECSYACAPMDRVAVEYDRIWGIDRLASLVPPEVAAKYGSAMAHLNACIDRGHAGDTAAAAANVIKGLHAMNRMAMEAGHQPLVADLWEFEIEGRKVAIMRDSADWRAAEAQRPGVMLFTMREVAIALTAKMGLVADIKAAFPGAQITAIRERTPLEESLDDEIPY